MNSSEIGGFLAEEHQVKKWPKKTIVVSSVISAYMLYFAMAHSRYITLLFVVIYWGYSLYVWHIVSPEKEHINLVPWES